MPRHARHFGQNQIYHVMLRGNDRQKIFVDDDDKNKIIQTITEKKKEGAFSIYAYCVMDNHIHIVIKEGSESLSLIMKKIATTYAYYFNKKYRRIGHVFQDRYKGYGFMLTAFDAQLNGDGVDRFRIKIWWIDPLTEAEVVVYDNELGEADDAEATTEIEGGNIVIHSK